MKVQLDYDSLFGIITITVKQYDNQNYLRSIRKYELNQDETIGM
ncbi:hypothetical protein [Rhizobium phage RHph_X2_28B]|nr:hypothetical protein PP751_gp002 [Rhizobium phage RHph_X2_28B]QWY83454.1 hypothetical protein [Rhizobium phage RHph_X2_28B]QWY83690.1 hypothetical protein [Rhizobium phage RHph_X3_15]